MGFAAGFAAGNNAVNNAVNNALKYKEMKEKRDADAAKILKDRNTKSNELNATAQNNAIKATDDLSKHATKMADEETTLEEYEAERKIYKKKLELYKQTATSLSNTKDDLGANIYNTDTMNMFSTISGYKEAEEFIPTEVPNAKGVIDNGGSATRIVNMDSRMSYFQENGSLRVMEDGTFAIAQPNESGGFDESNLKPTDFSHKKFKTAADGAGGSAIERSHAKAVENGYEGDIAQYKREEWSPPSKSTKVVKVKGKDGKPVYVNTEDAAGMEVHENLTGDEEKAQALRATAEFKKKYGHLPKEEQLNLSYRQVELRTKSFKDKTEDVGNTFSVENINNKPKDVDVSYENMSSPDKAKLHSYQRKSIEGKEHINNNAQKSIGVDEIYKQIERFKEIKPENWNKGVIKNQLNSLASIIPDNWNALSDEKKSESLNQIKGQGILGNIFFTYLNKVNKGAPSDADMMVMKEIVTGGDNASLSSTIEALDTWFKSVESDAASYYEGSYPSINTIMSKAEKQAYSDIKSRIESRESTPAKPKKMLTTDDLRERLRKKKLSKNR